MDDWSDGYIANIGYSFGYCTELNPLRARLAFLNTAHVPPDQCSHCELGYGQGMSTNIHAAASGSSWHGTDINPSHASFAQSLARASGANIHLTDESFADFANRSDLPEFDSIGLHGIWSWINDKNRAVIVDFVSRKLKVGGVLYISYNTQPGLATMVPMRELLTEYSTIMGVAGQGIVSRIDSALEFADKLFATHPKYVKANPQVVERLNTIKAGKRNYLAHEYFNRDWHPMSFARMAEWLAPTKLTYACSAYYLDHIDTINMSAEQQLLLKEIPNSMFRETVRDFMVNQQFRRDYWVKGARKLNTLECSEALRAQRVILTKPSADVSLEVTTQVGIATMNKSVYVPILDALSDHKPKSIDQIKQAVKDKSLSIVQVMEAVMILIGTGSLSAVQDDEVIAKARTYTDKLNTHLIDKARGCNDIDCLASPVTGGGVAVTRFQQLLLMAISKGKKQPLEWATSVCEMLAARGEKVVKDGITLESPEKNLAEITSKAHAFAEKQLPILKALQII
ncbi:MAG: class I SAM-dependent methyltransferase [Desulfuromonadaceae bacterium]|nr:class I SAM-dependent methyltransferase [Desulfuromonadaceae bacterium]MDD5106494.1 class I SAM-dependent methyltransferase [Desulfuromonadaceae bacterium]